MVEAVSASLIDSAVFHLTLGDHVHCLDAAEQNPCAAERLEAGVFVLFVHFLAVTAAEAACSKAERPQTILQLDEFSSG